MPVMNTCQQGVNQGSAVSDCNPSPLMIISRGVWHTYGDFTWPEHVIPRLGLKHPWPWGCVQQVDTSLVLNYLVIIPRTQQSSLPSAICDHSIVASPVVEPQQTPSTGTIVGCTRSVSSVSTHSCSLRQVCADPWHPTIIPPVGDMQLFHCGIPSS
jgi:hypothetical protein